MTIKQVHQTLELPPCVALDLLGIKLERRSDTAPCLLLVKLTEQVPAEVLGSSDTWATKDSEF